MMTMTRTEEPTDYERQRSSYLGINSLGGRTPFRSTPSLRRAPARILVSA